MTALFTILIVVVSVLLVLVILVQNPKGGGLSAAFGGDSPQMLGGVKKTTDFLDKATWSLVIALFVLVVGMNMVGTGTVEEQDTIMDVGEGLPQPTMPAPQTDASVEEAPAGEAPVGEAPLPGMPENVEQ